ncbi:MAG: phenylalanine--tRNA ligase subunit beta, partial [Chloroflexi bacterium]|nr:phenylalanine--tRNA ligase subunit beta [Chloroflexota bacterium]
VDITNYVMLEWGQPLHAFDLALLRGRKIVVRRARPGETLTTIDGVERPLEEGMLLITDAGEPIAVAGVMGGAASEVSEDTTAVLIESANFNRASIRRTSASLRMRTEASLRFDKGISPALAPLALRRATKLMVELAGGKAAQGIIDVYPGKKESLPIRLTRAHVRRLLSLELSTAEVTGTLKRLGFTCRKGGDQDILVNVPYWRTDVEMAEDLVEEIARIIGYDSLPTTMLSGSLPAPQENHLRTLKEKVRDILANCSLQEIITYSLTSQAALHNVFTSSQRITPIRVANPITNDQEYLRTTLRMGLLSTLAMNEWHEQDGIRIFEVGRVYWPREGDLPEEREMAAGLLSGSRQTASWWSKEETTEFFDVKGILESLGYRLGMGFTLEAGEEPFFQRGKMAQILVQGTPAGVVGEVDPQVLEAFQISSRPVYLFELDIGVLLASLPATRQYRPLLRFPSVTRDLALVVDARLPYQRVREIIQDFPLVSQVELFDVYRGEPIPDSQKSLAVRIVYQSSDRTLTEKEVYDIQEQILKRLEDEVGVRLRQ